ncbi:MAG TPA: ROK family protein [Candidatus Limnocylindrales bacterium]
MGGQPGATTRHLGLDLGGTNVKWVVAEQSGDDWMIVDQGEVPTLAARGPDAVIERLAGVGATAIVRSPGVTSVGIGVPGLYNPSDGTTRLLINLPGDWKGKPMASEVSRALRLPTHLINDARAFGLAELRLGAGRGASSMVGLTLGTGVGGVMAIDGRVHQGHDGTGGEFGHQTIDPDGPWCACGNRGCVEAFARADQIAAACGTETAEEAFERARAGDERAMRGVNDIGRYLGIGISNMVVGITPDRVVIGGGVAAALDLLLPPIQAELRRRVHVTSLDRVDIVPAQLGVWAGAIGAAIHGAEVTV